MGNLRGFREAFGEEREGLVYEGQKSSGKCAYGLGLVWGL